MLQDHLFEPADFIQGRPWACLVGENMVEVRRRIAIASRAPFGGQHLCFEVTEFLVWQPSLPNAICRSTTCPSLAGTWVASPFDRGRSSSATSRPWLGEPSQSRASGCGGRWKQRGRQSATKRPSVGPLSLGERQRQDGWLERGEVTVAGVVCSSHS